MKRLLPVIYLSINLACVLVVLYAGHRVTSLMVAEQRTESDGVDGISFFFMSAPAFAIALLANVVWCIKAIVDGWRRHEYRTFAWLAGGVVVWIVTIFGARFVWELSARLWMSQATPCNIATMPNQSITRTGAIRPPKPVMSCVVCHETRPMRLVLAVATGGVLALGLAGCGFVHDEKITGPYRLVAIDAPEQMSICYTLEKGDCVGRIPETVFSVGWNDRFIVAKQHPSNNRSVTNYFILKMARDNKLSDPSESVTGPLSAVAFEEQAVSLALPPFTKTIEGLK